MSIPFLPPLPDLPTGWLASVPTETDVDELAALVSDVRREVSGAGAGAVPADAVPADAVAQEAVGVGSWTRRQVVVRRTEAGGPARLVAWARVHDRAAGRTNVDLAVAPGCEERDALAAALLGWAERVAIRVARGRGLGGTQLDVSVHADDVALQRWLGSAGYTMTRTWLEMIRPVTAADADPVLRPGVRVRRIGTHDDGLPVAADLQTVHRMLEESFADHFNSYRESFPEFLQRQREATGHRWDHWWIAEIEVDGQAVPGGAVVSSVLTPDAGGVEGSYVDYIGVHRLARGRGVAKALLLTVVADARRRGRNRVALEVDADSPTGADGLYESMGWRTEYRTQSWHHQVDVPGHDGPVPEARPVAGLDQGSPAPG